MGDEDDDDGETHSPRAEIAGAEKVFRARVKRSPDVMYYIKGGDVWGVPRKRPGEPKGKAIKVVSAGIEMDYSKYLYFLDGDGDIARKARQVQSTPLIVSAMEADDVVRYLKDLAAEYAELDGDDDDDPGAVARGRLRRLMELANELVDDAEAEFLRHKATGNRASADRAMGVLLAAREVAQEARNEDNQLMLLWLTEQGVSARSSEITAVTVVGPPSTLTWSGHPFRSGPETHALQPVTEAVLAEGSDADRGHARALDEYVTILAASDLSPDLQAALARLWLATQDAFATWSLHKFIDELEKSIYFESFTDLAARRTHDLLLAVQRRLRWPYIIPLSVLPIMVALVVALGAAGVHVAVLTIVIALCGASAGFAQFAAHKNNHHLTVIGGMLHQLRSELRRELPRGNER